MFKKGFYLQRQNGHQPPGSLMRYLMLRLYLAFQFVLNVLNIFVDRKGKGGNLSFVIAFL